MGRRFMYVCFGILALVVAHQIGSTRAAAQMVGAPTEVAVLTGVANDGETIPLPTYADGTTALEAECRWVVSVRHLYQPTTGALATEVCSTAGRVVEIYGVVGGNDNWPASGQKFAGTANYMIVAQRGAPGATPVQPTTFGATKARFRK